MVMELAVGLLNSLLVSSSAHEYYSLYEIIESYQVAMRAKLVMIHVEESIKKTLNMKNVV